MKNGFSEGVASDPHDTKWKASMVRSHLPICNTSYVLHVPLLHSLYVSGHINWKMYCSIQFTRLQHQMLLIYPLGCTVLKWVLTHLLDLWKKIQELYFFLTVTCNIPRFFHYEYKHDEFGNSTYMATSLYRDKMYHLFWHTWQSLIYTFIPIIALCTINGKILWNLAKSNQNDAEISQNNGLRIHVGWVFLVRSAGSRNFW